MNDLLKRANALTTRLSAKGLDLKLIKSKHGPTYKMEIGGTLRGIELKGNLRQVLIGTDKLTQSLVDDQLTLNRADGYGKKVPHGVRRTVEQAILKKLQGIKEGSRQAARVQAEPEHDRISGMWAISVGGHTITDYDWRSEAQVKKFIQQHVNPMTDAGLSPREVGRAIQKLGSERLAAQQWSPSPQLKASYAQAAKAVDKLLAVLEKEEKADFRHAKGQWTAAGAAVDNVAGAKRQLELAKGVLRL